MSCRRISISSLLNPVGSDEHACNDTTLPDCAPPATAQELARSSHERICRGVHKTKFQSDITIACTNYLRCSGVGTFWNSRSEAG
jgi:hypothetical protein